jgi:predicted amidohydrolase
MGTNADYRVALFQFAPQLGDREANLTAIESGLEDAEADLFILPELATSGYALPDRDAALALAEGLGAGPGLSRLQALAERKDAAIIAGLPLLEGERLYNAAGLFRPGRPPVFYRKIHLFYRERELFDAGDRPLEVHEHRGLRLGIMICFDWVFPEVARRLTLDGAQLLAHPSNLVLPGFAQAAMVTRAVENGVFAATCNRVGEEAFSDEERPLRFTGLSQLLDNRGAKLTACDEQETALIIGKIDPTAAADKSLTPHNHLLDDRRPELYGGLPSPAPDDSPQPDR